jgi:hypothetical protein
MLVTIGVTAIVVLALCGVAHEWNMKNYKEEILYYKNRTAEYIDKYYDLLNEVRKEKTDQLNNTPSDYIMD